MLVIIRDLLPQQVDPVLGALEPLGRPDDADIIPHEAADLAPGLGDHDFLVAVGNPAFVPGADLRHFGEPVPIGEDVLRRRLAEHEAFEQAVRRQAVGAVEARLGHLARGVEARRVGAAVEVHHHAAARVMLRPERPGSAPSSCRSRAPSSFS